MAALISKMTGKYIYYRDYWNKHPDQEPFFKFFTAFSPFVVRDKENTYKLIHWGDLRIAFGNFNEFIIILAASVETSEKLIESYLIKTYELLLANFGDLTEFQLDSEKLGEFAQQLELLVRVSATKEDLAKLDYSVDERYGVTPASEEVNRRNVIHSEQAEKLLEQFAVEMLDGSITKFRLFLTAAVHIKNAINYDVIVDFSPYPHPPEFELPKELYAILGDAGTALDTIRDWDPISPPDWVQVVQELEEKIYKSETHLIEPIIEEPATPKKGKGFAKTLQMPTQQHHGKMPSPMQTTQPPKTKPFTTELPSETPEKMKRAEVPFQATLPQEQTKRKVGEREVDCPNCGYIFKSKTETNCPLCGTVRPD